MQSAFRNGTLANKNTCQTAVLIMKRGGGYSWWIALVEVLWKIVAGLLNRRFALAIRFHYILHGFWTDHGTGTVTLDAKLPQQ